jgi:5-methyltetrahydrofolate--homocysteine methyltransferase
MNETQYAEEFYFDPFIRGNDARVEELVRQDIREGMSAAEVVSRRLIATMEIVGRKFQNAEIFVPEMMIAARSMSTVLAKLKDQISEKSSEGQGLVCIGTVKGDLHDIGKNLVITMLEGHGFRVIDLGVSASADKFVKAVQDENPDIVAMSALLTTTMSEMTVVLNALGKEGLRDRVKVIIGGAPVTQAYAAQIGADGYAADAPGAVDLCKTIMTPAL